MKIQERSLCENTGIKDNEENGTQLPNKCLIRAGRQESRSHVGGQIKMIVAYKLEFEHWE